MNNGSIIYEGYDEYQDFKKEKDQPVLNKDWTQSENGKFIDAWRKFQKGERDPAIVEVFEKARKLGQGQVDFDGIRIEMPTYLNALEIIKRFNELKKLN